MKSFAFGDGEEITSLAGERTWISASGFKGDRLFYRQAALACGGNHWHHIAFEFPASAKRSMQDFIKRAVEKLNSGQNEGCDAPLSKSSKSCRNGETFGRLAALRAQSSACSKHSRICSLRLLSTTRPYTPDAA